MPFPHFIVFLSFRKIFSAFEVLDELKPNIFDDSKCKKSIRLSTRYHRDFPLLSLISEVPMSFASGISGLEFIRTLNRVLGDATF